MDSLIRRAVDDLAASEYAIALTGAGMSTESGIPDFRGPSGIWTTNRKAEAQAYRRYELFLNDARTYWEEMLGMRGTCGMFYEEIEKAAPNAGHHALAELEALGVLKCVITQNIDGLHRKAGSKRVLEYHGSVHALRCISCRSRHARDDVCLDVLPPRCICGAALKYDVVHFNEAIPSDVMKESEAEVLRCDLMIICGTSAVVHPFASLPGLARSRPYRSLPNSGIPGHEKGVTIIEVNDEPTPLTHGGVSDCFIRGKTGDLLPAIVEEAKRARSALATEHDPLLRD